MSFERSTIYGMLIFIVIVGVGYLMVNSGNEGITGNVVSGATGGDVQKIVIGMKNYNYYPNTVTVKAGRPVSLSLDSSVYGCFRDFTIRDLGVRKYLKTSSDVVEFTPSNPGRYTFACSMGMGTGTLVVE